MLKKAIIISFVFVSLGSYLNITQAASCTGKEIHCTIIDGNPRDKSVMFKITIAQNNPTGPWQGVEYKCVKPDSILSLSASSVSSLYPNYNVIYTLAPCQGTDNLCENAYPATNYSFTLNADKTSSSPQQSHFILNAGAGVTCNTNLPVAK